MIQLNEGLSRHELDHLILPLLDIDTFESKIDNTRAIVVAFYVFEFEPARDLDSFISKSSFDILDVETSPAPTIDGYYVVFVEISRNKDFPETLINLINEIKNLTDVKKWKFKTFGTDQVFELTEENLSENVNLDPKTIPVEKENTDSDETSDETDDEDQKSLAESAATILLNSLVESIHCEGDIILLNKTKKYRVTKVLDQEPSTPILIPNIGDPLISESMKLSNMLGNNYQVNAINSGLLVSSNFGYIIFKSLD